MFHHLFRHSKPYAQASEASRAQALIATHQVGQPQWTPRQYTPLAQEGYQRNVIVFRAVTLIARSLGSINWMVYKDKESLEKHPLKDLLICPNRWQAGSSFFEELVSSLLLSGNAYLQIGEENPPQHLYILRPDRMQILPHAQGGIGGFLYTVEERSLRLSPEDVVQIKFFHPLNDWYGQSPLEAAACAIDQHNAMSAHNLALLQNGGRPSGMLIVRSGQEGTPQEAEHLREEVTQFCQGPRNAGRLMVLEGNVEWREMGLSPKDLDFSEGRNQAAREIAQAFGVPPMLVGVPGDATFANYREARFHLWEDTILPLAELIKTELNLWLAPKFSPENLRLEISYENIPALSPRRESLWKRVTEATFLSKDEQRGMVGL